MVRHFISLADYSAGELEKLLQLAADLKAMYREGRRDTCLGGKTVALLFEKPSSRTRISFEVAMTQLGGAAMYLRQEDIGGLGRREPICDFVRVLNGYVDAIVARTYAHETVLELAKYARMPVINALTDLSHPCQAMADMLTIQEHLGRLTDVKLAYVGDGNNMARSLAEAAVKLGLDFVSASPEGYALSDDFVQQTAKTGSGSLTTTNSPAEAVQDADIVYTDTWVSMGQEDEYEKRLRDFAGFTIDGNLLQRAKPGAAVLHCLPAYRGKEITDDVIESPQSIVFQQAENRLHFQRALLKYLIVGDKIDVSC